MSYRPDIGVRLCEAFGLEPSTVTRIDMGIGVGETLRVDVEHVYFDFPSPRFLNYVTRHYRLVEDTWAPPLPPPANWPRPTLGQPYYRTPPTSPTSSLRGAA